MKATFLLLSAVLVSPGALYAQAEDACVRFYPVEPGNAGIYNNCARCMTAAMAWCDGSIQRADVAANSGTKFTACLGTVTLVGESPCAGGGAVLRPTTPEIAPSESQGVIADFSGRRIVTRRVAPVERRSEPCSAHNDVGDVCGVTCPPGQSSFCSNASGARPPRCACL